MQRDNPLVLLLPRPKKGYGGRSRFSYRHGLLFLALVTGWALWFYWSPLVEQVYLSVKRAPFYVSRDCDFSWEGMRHADCGYLYVKEDQRKDNGAVFRIPVAIFRSNDPQKRGDPLVYIPGGPGYAALLDARFTKVLWKKKLENLHWLHDRDLIVFDPRGVGNSVPKTDCHLLKYRIHFGYGNYKRRQEVALECLQELDDQGLDPTLFMSSTAANDLDDLRRVLGFRNWNIWAESYGTRVALTAMATFPNGIRSAILSGVHPLLDTLPFDTAKFPALVENLLAACKNATRCSRSYPEIEKKLQHTMTALRDNPVKLPVWLSRKQQQELVTIDDKLFLDVLFFEFYWRDSIRNVPRLIYEVAEQNYETLQQRMNRIDFFLLGPWFSLGMSWATYCNEGLKPNLTDLQAVASQYPWASNWLLDWPEDNPCTTLKWPKVATVQMEPGDNEIPTLLLSGYWDPTTPTEWAQSVAEFLPNGYLFIFTNAAHDATSGDCASDIITRFLASPMQSPDHPCYDNQPPLRFLE